MTGQVFNSNNHSPATNHAGQPAHIESKIRLWLYIILAVVIGIALLNRTGFAERQYLASFANKPAPNFALRDLNEATVSLEDYRGKDVVLAFWAYG